jgi:hypothetical protein
MLDELLVMQSQPSPVVNHHYVVRIHRNALDLVVIVEHDRISVRGQGAAPQRPLAAVAATTTTES